MAFEKPTGIILVKGDTAQGNGNEIFGIWPTGYTRQITAAEHELWGSPVADHQIPAGADDQFDQLRDYDRGLKA